MKLFSLFVFLLVCTNAKIGLAEEVVPGNPLFGGWTDEKMTPEEYEEFAKSPGSISCRHIETGQTVKVAPGNCKGNPLYFVPDEDYTTIKTNDDLKLSCPNDINLDKSKYFMALTNEKEPNFIAYRTICSYKSAKNKKIKIDVGYLVKCKVTGQDPTLSVINLRQKYDLNYENLSKCLNSEKKEMSFKEIFDLSKPVRVEPVKFKAKPRNKPAAGSI